MNRRRALLSVYDKTGLVELGKTLHDAGLELVASGGTARTLLGAGLAVTEVADATGSPEILGGRVKTLHPVIHGGILARPNAEHLDELARHDITPVDVVVCNLYPFVETVARPGVTESEAIEEIDIGGVTLLRAAAKNFERVVVLCDPDDYAGVGAAIAEGSLGAEQRRSLALKAFLHTASYDAAISNWLGGRVDGEEDLPQTLCLTAERGEVLRYGENPHQRGALYRWTGGGQAFEQLQGKALSFNNLVDLEAAWAMPAEFSGPAVAIIKHTNPSGLATADDVVSAFQAALACDPISAFGSIIAVNREVTLEFIEAVGKLFVEVIIAPSFTDEAL
ncbi:MAG: bifunctional phosphoribosylaminoimidazolecarboxamide formyltransferase/IMP cyclohydrolase, partial [Myxococcota bacterium]|nr:bifunctional phosphoribosylaminoimidazolecarboxamide formyltransferase/IMP cyclohydrolase [Myxococcota bacterium]